MIDHESELDVEPMSVRANLGCTVVLLAAVVVLALAAHTLQMGV